MRTVSLVKACCGNPGKSPARPNATSATPALLAAVALLASAFVPVAKAWSAPPAPPAYAGDTTPVSPDVLMSPERAPRTVAPGRAQGLGQSPGQHPGNSRDQRTLGYQLSQILPGSIYDKMGLLDGDIIMEINGALATPERIYELASLERVRDMTLKIKREGRVRRFSYNIEKVSVPLAPDRGAPRQAAGAAPQGYTQPAQPGQAPQSRQGYAQPVQVPQGYGQQPAALPAAPADSPRSPMPQAYMPEQPSPAGSAGVPAASQYYPAQQPGSAGVPSPSEPRAGVPVAPLETLPAQ